jgi:hypothetical protein
MKYFLITSCLFFLALPAHAQRSAPAAASACLVSEFRSIAFSTHDIEQRIAKINDWIKQKGGSCTPSQLSAIASNRATWLGSADTVAISSSIDGLLEAKIKDDPDLMARMYSSRGKDFKPSSQVTQPPPAPAPVVASPASEMGAMGAAGPVMVQMQANQSADNTKKAEAPDESFTRRQRREIQDYYEENRGSDECPRGMTKRGANCESRFKERDWKLGQPLPASERAEDLPMPILLKLGKPPAEHQYKRLGVDILLLKGPEKKVTDAVLDLGGIKAKEEKIADPTPKK